MSDNCYGCITCRYRYIHFPNMDDFEISMQECLCDGEDSGFVKIHRKIFEWGGYSDINTFRVFVHMILKANWKEGKFKDITVPRGSFVSSIAKLAEETGLTADEVRTAISHLIHTGEVTKQSTNKYTVFTVVNYVLYQDVPEQLPNSPQTIPELFPTIEEGKTVRRKEEFRNIASNISCPEPEKSAPTPSGILLPLNDKSFYDVPQDKITLWRETYPAVDIEQELRRMIAWLDSNPTKRKTRKGIERFINNWLARTQDSGGSKGRKEVSEAVGNNNFDTDSRRERISRAIQRSGNGFRPRTRSTFPVIIRLMITVRLHFLTNLFRRTESS